MGKVFIVQEPMRVKHDPDDGKPVPVPMFNLDPARVYGELVNLLPKGNTTYSPQKTVEFIKDAMPEYTSDDYICPTGTPAIVGIAIAIAAKMNNGKVNVLIWDKRDKQYRPMTYTI